MVNLSVIINRFNRKALPLLPGPPLWILVLMRFRAEVRRAGHLNLLSIIFQLYLLGCAYIDISQKLLSDKYPLFVTEFRVIES